MTLKLAALPYNLGTIKITLRPLGDERNEASQKVLGKGSRALLYIWGYLYTPRTLYTLLPIGLLGQSQATQKPIGDPRGNLMKHEIYKSDFSMSAKQQHGTQ